jgi:thiol-disulfide isomerase/thioredoxin
MNRIVILLVFLLLQLFSFGQDTHQIKVKIANFVQQELYLGYFYGDKQYIRDTTQLGKDGYFTFAGKDTLPSGVYLIVLPPDNSYFQLLINENEQKVTIETALPNLSENPKIKGSFDNQLLYEYLSFLNKKRPQADEINNALKTAKDKGEDTQKFTEQLEKLNDEVVEYQKSLVQKNPKTLTAAIIRANMPKDEPKSFSGETEQDKQIARWRWNLDHYFDNLDLHDNRLLRTPFLFPTLNDYTDKMVIQHPDTISLAIDRILDAMKPNSEIFKFYLIHFLNKYAQSNIVGMDAVYVHIVDKYYAKGLAPWTEEEQLAKIMDNADKLKPILIGKVAPNVLMQLRDKKEIWLHDVKSPYTIIMVWDPDCGHCKKSMPDVKKFYEEFKDKGIEIFAICNKAWEKDEEGKISLKEVDKCWEYIDENQIGDWLNVVDPFNRSKYRTLYFIQATPQIFILDKDKKIISKRIAGEQLSDVMNKIIEIDQKKWEEKSK